MTVTSPDKKLDRTVFRPPKLIKVKKSQNQYQNRTKIDEVESPTKTSCLNISINKKSQEKSFHRQVTINDDLDYGLQRYQSSIKIPDDYSQYEKSPKFSRMQSKNFEQKLKSKKHIKSMKAKSGNRMQKFNKMISFNLELELQDLNSRLLRISRIRESQKVFNHYLQSGQYKGSGSTPHFSRLVTFKDKQQQSPKQKGRKQMRFGSDDQQQSQGDIEQFQSAYFTIKESRPELFKADKAFQQIKVDGFMENLTSDMQLMAQLHEGLDVVPNSQKAKTSLNKNENSKVKVDELINNNKGVWEKWWSNKLKSSQAMINNAKKGNFEEVAKLIDSNYNDDLGASINYQEPQTGFTALHYATKQGDLKIINLLIQNTADVMVQDGKGQTALHIACQRGDLEAYKLLTQRCYQAINCVDVAKKTPLDYAIEGKHTIIIEFDKQLTFTLFSHQSGDLGQYKLKPQDFEHLMPLGRGAFGEVILVKKEEQYFAMKIMKKRKFNGLINLVLTEKEIQRKVMSKFIVSLKYAFQTFDKLYIVSEYCAGGDMRGLLSQKQRLSESEARLYLAEILTAIEELHKHGIIHRDIKLDNILLDKDGHIKITDFGLSKEGMFEKKLTNTMLGGGRSYQIPEVINEHGYDKSVDLYLFGLLAYEIMTGTPAFPPDVPDLEDRILRSDYKIPMQLTPESRDMVQRLIVTNPEGRLSIRQLKKHPFFKSIDWKMVSEFKQKMPKPYIRPIEKSNLPMDANDSDEEEEDNRSYEEAGGPQRNQEEEIKTVDDGGGDYYVYDEKSNKFVTHDINSDPFSDVNNMTRVPNFSYAGDQDALRFQKQGVIQK
ncbi:protein kinase domain containing protein [Stylonychia lemnae]|uniref:Protein kinase domain containing protein n=1 Tax=Stylonychia lemnae TaxID=5949 RepID=A0A078A8X8_STYLE|nr:protein kinase domain containing protein [Stylonychia lemnae]|eukprot:CDW78002.1 protein kinase domain containing protein [Stylonychia lemnae]